MNPSALNPEVTSSGHSAAARILPNLNLSTKGFMDKNGNLIIVDDDGVISHFALKNQFKPATRTVYRKFYNKE